MEENAANEAMAHMLGATSLDEDEELELALQSIPELNPHLTSHSANGATVLGYQQDEEPHIAFTNHGNGFLPTAEHLPNGHIEVRSA